MNQQQTPANLATKILVMAIASASLAACGGGGGGSDGGIAGVGQKGGENTLQINEQNATQVAKSASSANSLNTASAAGTSSAFGNEAARPLDEVANKVLARALSSDDSGRITTPFNCPAGGSIIPDITGAQDASTGVVTFQGTMTYDHCQDDNEYDMSGPLEVSGSMDQSRQISMDLTGSLSMTELATSHTGQFDSFVSSITVASSQTTYTMSFHASGALFDNETFSLSTIEPVVSYGDAEPTSGTYRIDGANSSYMTMRMDGQSGVWLAVDGGSEKFVTWDELDNTSLENFGEGDSSNGTGTNKGTNDGTDSGSGSDNGSGTSDGSSGSGDQVTQEQEPNDDAETATAITLGVPVAGSLEYDVDGVDIFSIQLTAGQSYHLSLNRDQSSNLSLVYPYIVDVNGMPVSKVFDQQGLGFTFTARSSGTYDAYLFADGIEGKEQYQFEISEVN